MNICALYDAWKLVKCLEGIASCSTCDACRGAAQRVLDEFYKATGGSANPHVTPTPGVEARGPFLENKNG